jgi:hypothetical protein
MSNYNPQIPQHQMPPQPMPNVPNLMKQNMGQQQMPPMPPYGHMGETDQPVAGQQMPMMGQQGQQYGQMGDMADSMNRSMGQNPNMPPEDEDIPDYPDPRMGGGMPQRPSGGMLKSVPEMWREPLILFVLYVVLAQPTVVEGLAKYIPQLATGADGKPTLTGMLVFGVLLALGFVVVKKFIK